MGQKRDLLAPADLGIQRDLPACIQLCVGAGVGRLIRDTPANVQGVIA